MLCIIIEWVVLRYKMMPIIVRVPIIIFNKDVKKTHSIKSSSLLLRQLTLEVMAIVSKKTIGASVPVHEYLMAVLPSAPAVEPGVDVQSGQGHSLALDLPAEIIALERSKRKWTPTWQRTCFGKKK